jgi:hypothetical protein
MHMLHNASHFHEFLNQIKHLQQQADLDVEDACDVLQDLSHLQLDHCQEGEQGPYKWGRFVVAPAMSADSGRGRSDHMEASLLMTSPLDK